MKKKIMVFLLSAFMLFPAFAAEVTISDAVESAKANSISLEIAKDQLEQSLRKYMVIRETFRKRNNLPIGLLVQPGGHWSKPKLFNSK